MRLIFLTVTPFFILAACAEKTVDQLTYSEREALAETFIQNCEKQGLTIDDPEMVTCFRIEADRETKRREDSAERAEKIGMAISAGAKGYSDGYNRAASSYRAPVNCTSRRLGNSVNTTCY
jgi:hypothetical protein